MIAKVTGSVKDPEKYNVIMGIDSASTGVAWTLFDSGKMRDCGKIKLDKIKNVPDKLGTIHKELAELLHTHQPDHVFVEKSIFVRNPATARLLSYVVGSIIATCNVYNVEVTDVEPSTWKAYFGYKNLSSKFVQQAKEKLGSTEGKKFCDRLRKSQTWRIVRHNFPEAIGSLGEEDNDISDSFAISVYGYDKLHGGLNLQISKEVSLDLPLLATLGLSL